MAFQSYQLVTCQPCLHSAITLINQQLMIKLKFASNFKRRIQYFVVFLLLKLYLLASIWGIFIVIKCNILFYFSSTRPAYTKSIFLEKVVLLGHLAFGQVNLWFCIRKLFLWIIFTCPGFSDKSYFTFDLSCCQILSSSSLYNFTSFVESEFLFHGQFLNFTSN